MVVKISFESGDSLLCDSFTISGSESVIDGYKVAGAIATKNPTIYGSGGHYYVEGVATVSICEIVKIESRSDLSETDEEWRIEWNRGNGSREAYREDEIGPYVDKTAKTLGLLDRQAIIAIGEELANR